MSAAVKLSAALPGDFETNGIDAIAPKLLEDPETLRVAVVWFDVAKLTHDVDSGSDVPTIRVRRIEPLGNADDVTKVIRGEVEKAIQARTGRKPIPWELAEVAEGYDPDQRMIGDDD